MADQRDSALNYIRLNGPVIPVQISKVLNTNILFASAVLSELVERKVLKMTSAAIGGSKVYYIPRMQEPLLGDKLFHALAPVEKEVFILLKEKKVLRDKELDPKERIALRDLKDFAVPLTITLGSQSEIFWKFHVLSDDDAKPIISQYIEEIPVTEVKIEQKQEIPQSKFEDVVAKLKEELMKEIAPKMQEVKKDEAKEIAKQETKPAVKEEVKQSAKIEVRQAKKPRKQAEVKIPEIKEEEIEEVIEEIAFVDKTMDKKPAGRFYSEILDFFNGNGIKILKEEMIKKDKEYDFIVRVPSALGVVSYFIKARDKKTFNESDVSLAYSAGQLKNLPTILLGKGKLNKKAISLVDEKLSGKVVFKELV